MRTINLSVGSHMKIKLFNYLLPVLFLFPCKLSCSESLVKDWQKFGISTAMITAGLALTGLAIKVIKENFDNSQNYWRERKIFEKKA